MLLHRRILLRALVLMLVVAGLHFLALTFYFYWQLWWFDILMHFLGGVVVGLGALWALLGFSVRQGFIPTPFQMFLAVIAAGLIVGLSWEIYELYFRLFDAHYYAADTSLDVVMDLTGATVAYFYVRRLQAKAL